MTMKHLLFILLTTTLLVSCSDSDDNILVDIKESDKTSIYYPFVDLKAFKVFKENDKLIYEATFRELSEIDFNNPDLHRRSFEYSIQISSKINDSSTICLEIDYIPDSVITTWSKESYSTFINQYCKKEVRLKKLREERVYDNYSLDDNPEIYINNQSLRIIIDTTHFKRKYFDAIRKDSKILVFYNRPNSDCKVIFHQDYLPDRDNDKRGTDSTTCITR